MSTVKEEARKLIEQLPSQATWDDVMYEFYVRKKIATGLKSAKDGRVVAHDAVRKRLLPR
jgi:hypothetical protein